MLDAMLLVIILCLSFFTSFVLLISIVPSHNSKVINGFTITVVKIIIIKVSIIKHYAIVKEYNNIRVYITKDYITMWHRGVVFIITAHLHSTKLELRFCAGSKPACGVLEIEDGEDL